MRRYYYYKILRFFHIISKGKFLNKTEKYTSDYKKIAKSKLFNKKWYLENYPGVKSAGIDPIAHYLYHGCYEGKNPSPLFDNDEYFRVHPEIVNRNINPLIHFMAVSKKEGVKCKSFKKHSFEYINPGCLDRLVCHFKNKTPKISIIVTSYNYEDYIGETLESLINQTYKNYEIIVVDDGSKDDSVKVIKEYTDKYGFIKLYQHEGGTNKGLIATMKLALSKTSGDYVAFCESDDYWANNHLEEKVKIIGEFANPVIITNDVTVFGNDLRCKAVEDGTLVKIRYLLNKTVNKITYNDFRKRQYIPTLSCCMIRRKDLIKCNLTDNPRPSATDWWIYRQLAAKGNKIYYVPEQLTFWRMHSSYNSTQHTDFLVLQPSFNRMSDEVCHIISFTERKKERKKESINVLKNSAMFNSKWYKQQYNIPDNIDPALHYLHAGWRKGYNPSELFDTDLYLSFYNEIKTNPLIDYENRAHDKRYAPSCIRKPFDILFISSIPKIDGVYLWRVKFLKELFEYNGYTTAEESLTELSPEFLDKLYNAKCVVFSRPVNSGMSAKIIKELKKYKKKFIIDIDDLLINSFAAYGGRYKSGGIDYRSVSRNILSQSECFEYCNSMFVSTPFIKNAVKKDFNISVSVLPNVISPKYLKMKHYNRTKGFKLLYASGSITHDNDASTIYLDLLNILYKYKDVSLTVLGWSSFQNNFKMFQDRICTIPFTSFENMLSIYAGSDLLLVPLDYNPFNNAKSNIKYIEAGAVGTPVIARDTDEFRAVIKDGFNGFLYNDNFYEKFEEIYQNKDCLVTVGENAYSDVLNNHCTNRKLAREIKELLC